MTDWTEPEKQLAARQPMSRRPIAIAFFDPPPTGVPKFSGSEPTGCSYWGWRLRAARFIPWWPITAVAR